MEEEKETPFASIQFTETNTDSRSSDDRVINVVLEVTDGGEEVSARRELWHRMIKGLLSSEITVIIIVMVIFGRILTSMVDGSVG